MDALAGQSLHPPPSLAFGPDLPVAEGAPEVLPDLLRLASEQAEPGRVVRVGRDGGEVTLGYDEVRHRAERILRGLRALGARPGEEVVLQAAAADEFVPALWACILGGFPVVPVGAAGSGDAAAQAVRRLRDVWNVLGRPLVVTGTGEEGGARAALGGEARVAPVAELAAAPADAAWHPGTPDAIAVLLLSSGTTGRPKLIQRSHRNLLRACQGSVAMAGIGGRRITFLNWLPLDHNAALTASITLLAAGADQVHLGTQDVLEDPERWLDALHRYRVSHTGATNYSLGLISGRLAGGGERGWDFSGVERITVTAEPVVARTVRTFLERMSPYGLRREVLRTSYGMSEVGGIARLAELPLDRDGESDSIVEVGTPFPGISLRVVDAGGRVVPEGCEGRVQVRGETVTPGYARDGEQTRASFTADGWFDTGDAGFLRAGSLTITGRDKDVLIVNGLNLQSQEVEAAVEELEGVERGCTAVCPVRLPGGDTDGAAVFLHTGLAGAGERAALRREVRRVVAGRFGATVAHVLLVGSEEIPRTPLGKIRRSALRRELEAGGFVRAVEEDSRGRGHGKATPPRSELERELCGVWAEVLGVDGVGIDEDFLALGGHSLLASRIVGRVRAVSGVDVPLGMLFEHPTVAGLAGAVEALRRGGGPAAAPPPVRAPLEGPVPLSFAQQRLWFLDRLQPGGSVYNLSRALRLRGPLDVAVLSRVLGEVVRRHEPLRTSFPEVEGGPVQVIAPPSPPGLGVEDLASLPAGAREAELARRVGAAAAAPYDLARGPLFRSRLLRLAEDDHVLLLGMHHVVGDGWSIGVLFREIEALYPALLGGGSSPLALLPVRYADHAVRQRAALAGEAWERQLAYWRSRLAGAPALLELPTDRVRPAVQSHRGEVGRFALCPELTRRLAGAGRAEGATLFMTLLAAFQLLLSRYSGSEDVVVGTPVAGRTRPELEGLVGLFVNTLALRTDLAGAERLTFRELLGRVREVALGAYAHQEVPFERLVEELRPERSLGHSPVFQVVLALQNAGGEPPRLPGIETRPVRTGANAAMFDLTLHAAEDDGELRGVLEYASDLFDASTAERMLRHLERVLEQVAAGADVRLGDLELLGTGERHQVLEEWSRPQAQYPAGACVHELFQAQAERTPGAVALVYEDQALSYGELDARANRLAHHLVRRGVGPEVRVGLCLERSLELVVSILAVLKAGGAYVPLDPQHPAERLAFMLADAGVQVLLTRERLPGTLPEFGGATVCLDGDADAIARGSGRAPGVEVGTDGLAYVIYTSGSTGRPKGVQVTHGNVVRLFGATGPRFGFGERDVWTLFHSCAFDFSVWEIWGALLHGGRLVVVPFLTSRSPGDFYRLLAREGVTVLSQTPSAFRQLIAAEEEPGAAAELALRTVVFGGEALEPGMLRPWMERHGEERPRLVNMYGITETTVHVTFRPITAGDVERGSGSPIGRALPDLGTYVLDPSGRPAPVGVPGELSVGGAGVARGYLGRPELTAERFVPDPFSGVGGARLYRSGDRARWLASGQLEYLGRLDEQVKVRGFRIEPGEVEAVLLRHPRVREATVVAHDDPAGDRRLVAYLTTASEPPAPHELRAHLAAALPDYMVPAAFVVLDSIPLTANGKVDRRALPAPGYGSAGERYVAPGTPVEEVLAGIWAEVLGLERVGVQDGFFDLGGHSLLAIRVVSRVREALGGEIGVAAIFRHPTVAGLARFLSERGPAGPATAAGAEPVSSDTSPQRLLAVMDDLSDEELDRLLAGRL